MKEYLKQSVKLTAILIVLLVIIYPVSIRVIAYLSRGEGNGQKVYVDGKAVGYELIGQEFKQDKYFWGRPSAVGYNAAGSGGSNKGPTNPEYLKTVKSRIDTFFLRNSDIKRNQVLPELVTASGSGLDPDISPKAAYIQIPRVAKARNMNEIVLRKLIDTYVDEPLWGVFGPAKVNVLKLNIALDDIK